MNDHHGDVARWLSRERDQDDAAAEEAFGLLFQSLPRPEADADVIGRLAAGVWRAQQRRRRVAWTARIAAALVVTALSAAIGYGLLVYAAPWLGETSIALAEGSARALANLTHLAVGAWGWAGRLSGVMRTWLARPESLALVCGLETTGILALWGLHRLVRAERGRMFPARGEV